MAGKGSRYRTYGAKYNDNWDRIFGSKKEEPVGGPQSDSEILYQEGKANLIGQPKSPQRASQEPSRGGTVYGTLKL